MAASNPGKVGGGLAARLRLMAITDRRLCGGSLQRAVSDLIRGGITALMLREKDLPPGALYELAAPLCGLCADQGVLFLVNGSVEVARACGAGGVHLGGEALSPKVASTLLDHGQVMGVSAHTPNEVAAAARAGADYVTYAPIFSPNSKADTRPPLGVEAVASASGVLPLVALGGLTPVRAAACLRAGAAGVAAIGALIGAPDPHAAAHSFCEQMDGVVSGDGPLA